MANNRLKQETDSTGMLLDTVCNFFGGIVLIALLIALTSSNESSDIRKDTQEAMNETIERKIKDSESDLAALDAFKDEFDQAALLFATIVKIEKTVQLHKELESLRNEFMEQKSINDEIKTQLQFVKSQIALGNKKVRFPSRKPPTKESIILIVANDSIYPVLSWNNGKLSPNRAMVDFRLTSKKAALLVPKPGSGLPASTLDTTFINQVPNSFYLMFAVYKDSFSAFNEAKHLVASKGFEFGWAPYLKGEKIIISPKGAKLELE